MTISDRLLLIPRHMRGLLIFSACFIAGFTAVFVIAMGGSPAIFFVPGLFFFLGAFAGSLYLGFQLLRFVIWFFKRF